MSSGGACVRAATAAMAASSADPQAAMGNGAVGVEEEDEEDAGLEFGAIAGSLR